MKDGCSTEVQMYVHILVETCAQIRVGENSEKEKEEKQGSVGLKTKVQSALA